jgi:thiamine-phosphate pyrophosphorylase
MTRRQTMPEQWFVAHARSRELWATLGKLPRGSGVIVTLRMSSSERRRLRHLSRVRGLTVVMEQSRVARRVHDIRELRQALLRRTPLILLSPIYPTRTHPHWAPLPRLRAAALARLADRRLIGLGGMDPKRYSALRALGFSGWAGISAFRT